MQVKGLRTAEPAAKYIHVNTCTSYPVQKQDNTPQAEPAFTSWATQDMSAKLSPLQRGLHTKAKHQAHCGGFWGLTFITA